jgi:hypothetical protein
MNKVLYIILISLFSLSVISCGEKEEESTTTTGITYPSSGNHGDNLLRNESITLSTSSGTYYSLRVEKEVGSIVKIIFPIPNDSSNMWYWSSSVSNWYEGSGSSGTAGGNRIFITESRALYSDMRIHFQGSQSVIIEIYENGVTTATRTKTLSW